jgi:uncharacterized protein YrzB (UPF0473 family)
MEIAPKILQAFETINQPRSNYQLEHFVVGQQDTKEMQYYQVVLEMKSMFFAIRRTTLLVEKNNAQIEELEKFDSRGARAEIALLQLSNDEIYLDLKGMLREWSRLEEIFNSFDKNYTRQEIEDGQKDYWHARLMRQAEFELLGSGQMTFSQLDAMHQTGELNRFIEEIATMQKELGSFRGELQK